MNTIWAIIKKYKLLIFSILIILIGLAFDVAGINYPNLRNISHAILAIQGYSISIIVAWRMIQELRNGIWGVDVLALAAILTATILGQYWAAMIVIIMLLGGEALEECAESRATSELSELLKRAPQRANLIRGRKTLTVPADQIIKNDRIVIKPGEVVPADCIILDGMTSVDESSITGESLPINKKIGDEILSGSINIDGAITAKVIRPAKDSQYEQIIKLVKTATTSQAPFARLADKYTIPFSILAFAISGGVWALTGDVNRFLEVLVVATPCPLILGAPVGLISGMSRAARHGIIIKTGTALEKLASINTLAFDKTGTLTKGRPEVSAVKSIHNKYSEKKIIELAASVEQYSTHILAQAILEDAKSRNIKLIKPRGAQELSGQGLEARIGKDLVTVGRLSYIQGKRISTPSNFKISSDQTITFVAVNNELVGEIYFHDEIRTESKNMLTKIKNLGIKHTLMITGDHQRIANKIARDLGVSDVVSDCLPGDKVRTIDSLNNEYRPAGFVGDGVNDAPVLTSADIGIALGAKGSTAASESADVVILQDNIELVADSIDIAKNTFKTTKQAILIGITMSLGLMAIFATGRYEATYGAAIQELVDVTVILYALRAHSD